MASPIHMFTIIFIFFFEYSLSANLTSFDDSIHFDSNETGVLEGSGELIVEEYRFVLPVRKRRNVVSSTEVLGDGSGDYAYEIGVREMGRKKRDSSSSENISVNLPGNPESRKRRDTSDLRRVSENVLEDAEKLRKDENLLDEAIKRLQSIQEGNFSDFEVSPVSRKHPVQGSNDTVPASTPKTGVCLNNGVCHSDKDCNGGMCNGNFLGTCNCNACLNFWQCYSDDDCGGFEKACNMTTHMCNCFGAFVLNGYADTLDALAHLCNVKTCHSKTASQNCFGLPCNVGRCECEN